MNTDVQSRQTVEKLSHTVIGAAFEVTNTLGAGFLEQVYEKALARELGLRGVTLETQVPLPVRYKGERIGSYVADVLVDQCLLVELKCVEQLRREHIAQCLNYLAATGLPLCLLLNFRRPRLEWKRVVRELR